MDTQDYSSLENQCHHCVVLSHKDKGLPKMHLIPEAPIVIALDNLAASGAFAEDEVGIDSENQYVVIIHVKESNIYISNLSIHCRGDWKEPYIV